MLTRTEIGEYALIGFAMTLLLIFVSRPVAVVASLGLVSMRKERRIPRRQVLFYSLVGPRGVVSVVMSTVPYTVGLETGNAMLIKFGPSIAVIVSFMVLFSIILQTIYVPYVSRALFPPQNGGT
jgi:NhaP-type Na+/H+ or K+/H+ antiporter